MKWIAKKIKTFGKNKCIFKEARTLFEVFCILLCAKICMLRFPLIKVMPETFTVPVIVQLLSMKVSLCESWADESGWLKYKSSYFVFADR